MRPPGASNISVEEALGVFLVLLPAPGLQLARHVDQTALLRVFSNMSTRPGWKVTTRCHSVFSTRSPVCLST